MIRVMALMFLASAAGAAFATQPMGRLFFTPAERAGLDNARIQKGVPAKTVASEQMLQVSPAPQIVTYDGLVRRNDGKSTLWLNNKPFDEREPLSGGAVSGRVRQDGALTLQVSQSGASINLRVGQSAELQSGRIVEGKVQKQEPAGPPATGKTESVAKDASAAKASMASKLETAPLKQSIAEITDKKPVAASISPQTPAR